MASSPGGASSPPWPEHSVLQQQQQDGGQLLQELQALSQALYHAQRHSLPPQAPQAPAPARARSPSPSPSPSPPAPNKRPSFFSSRKESLPSSRFSPFLPHPSRHSVSLFPPPSSSSSWLDHPHPDVRSRVDRRLSLQPLPQQQQHQQQQQQQHPSPDELDWADDTRVHLDSNKKKSIWNWKPLRALTHIGRQRFHCVFSAYVHAVEGLPAAMNGLRLCVRLRKEETREGAVQTVPCRVFQGVAEFQETLSMKCTLYGSKGPSNNMKFMSKAFIVSVIAPDVEELDFGKHQLDLSRLLADAVEDRKGELEKGYSWDTILELLGKAKGGKLIITLEYEMVEKDSVGSGNSSSRFGDSPPRRSSIHSTYSAPNSAHATPRTIIGRAQGINSPSAHNDYDNLVAMEHLNLDDPSPFADASDIRGERIMEVKGFPAFSERPTGPPHDVFSTFPSYEPKLNFLSQVDDVLAPSTLCVFMGNSDIKRESKTGGLFTEGDGVSSEDEADFVVVDKGVEIDNSIDNSMDDGEVIEKAPDDPEREDINDSSIDDGTVRDKAQGDTARDDCIPRDDCVHNVDVQTKLLDDSNNDPKGDYSQIVQVDKDQEQLEADKEVQLGAVKEQDSELGEILENKSEVYEEKIVNLQESKKEETANGKLEMRTVESLLQGSSAQVQTQEEIQVNLLESEKEDTANDHLDMRTLESLLQGSSAKVQTEDEIQMNSQESEKEESATYKLEIRTLESLLQGSGAKKQTQEEIKEKVLGLEQKTAQKILREEDADHILEIDAEGMEDDNLHTRVVKVKYDEKLEEKTELDQMAGQGIHGQEDASYKQLMNTFDAESIQEDSDTVSCTDKMEESETIGVKMDCDEDFEEKAELEQKAVHGDEDENYKQWMNISNANGMEDGSDTAVGISLTPYVRGIEAEVAEEEGLPDNLDTEIDIVAGEFLHMLESSDNHSGWNSESEPDSPRARLLKQFEHEAMLVGGFGIDSSLTQVPELLLDDTPVGEGPGVASSPASMATGATMDNRSNLDIEEDKELSFIMEAVEFELQRATQSLQSRTRAKTLEDAETEALMQEWGLNEKAFASSPPKHIFKQHEPPPLGRGLGDAVPVKDGGTLRSMNPLHFQASKCTGKLVMQVSKPVVVPAEMGSGTVDILRNMAMMGIENMACQAMTAMPLEDITGISLEQIAQEGMVSGTSFRNGQALEGPSQVNSITKQSSWNDRKFGLCSEDNNYDCISLEDLAPMAMEQIESLAIDGLKIQSDLTEEDAPYALNAFSVQGQVDGEGLSNHTIVGTLQSVTGVHLPKGARVPGKASGSGNVMMDMAISLDEWMLLDAGLYDETETKKDTLAVMAAHHAVHQDLVLVNDEEKSQGGKQQSSRSKGKGWGHMGNTLTIAMLVQLRDPSRSNEAVGAPMMAFVQAERMVVPSKPKVGRTVSFNGNGEDEETSSQSTEPRFKIIGVDMAGLKASQETKKLGWGSQKQQQTGSRWLIANGMSKSSKSHPLLASLTAPTTTNVKMRQGESLWSISARGHGSGIKWKDMMKLHPHIRNPDVVYENQTLLAI